MADRDSPIRISDDPFKISYMEYDTDRYEELLQSKIDTVMAKLPTSINEQIVLTDIIRSPVKHFRQRCRFAVMPSALGCSNICHSEIVLESHQQSTNLAPTSSYMAPDTSISGMNSNIFPPATLDTTAIAVDSSSKSNGDKTLLTYVLWETGGPNVYVDAFPIASITIYNAMPLFLAHIQTIEVLRTNLRAINFLSTRSGDLLATLVYELEIGEAWEVMATEMCNELGKKDCITYIQFQHLYYLICPAPSYYTFLVSLKLTSLHVISNLGAKIPGVTNLGIIGRCSGVCIVVKTNHVKEVLHLSDGRKLTYLQVEGAFSNPNGHVNEKALEWICSAVNQSTLELTRDTVCCSSSEGNPLGPNIDLLELYCGNGNHTVAIAGITLSMNVFDIIWTISDFLLRSNLFSCRYYQNFILFCFFSYLSNFIRFFLILFYFPFSIFHFSL